MKSPAKRNIKLVISYDGTEYAGWQIQHGQQSVQGCVEQALADLHGRPVSLTGAGRTDAGVHALGQVGNFYTEMEGIPAGRFRSAVNARLPRDIRILSSQEVPESFHSRYDAVARRYEYRIIEGPAGPAHMARYTWQVKGLSPLCELNQLASVVCGVHDFTTFTATGDSSQSRIRQINHAVFLSSGPFTVFRIDGNAFLRRMVRSILGTIIDLARRGGNPQAMRDILRSEKREAAGPTAPSRGLFLAKVEYGSHISAP